MIATVPGVRTVVLILALAVIGGCSGPSQARPGISTVQQLQAEIESQGVDCTGSEIVDPGAIASQGEYVSEAASCGSVMIAVLPARLEMSPVVQSVFEASQARSGADVAAVAHSDTWIVSCGTDVEVCRSVAEGLDGTLIRRER